MLVDKIRQLTGSVPDADSPFAEFEEEALISLALDLPDYFVSIAGLLDPRMFSRYEIQYVMSWILDYYKKYATVPTRRYISTLIKKDLTADEMEAADRIMELVNRPADPRDLPGMKEALHSWAKHKTYSMLYGQEAYDAFVRKDYDKLEEIVQQANRIVEVGNNGFWFYEQLEELFLPDSTEHFSTGYQKLDRILGGGPAPGEVLCWMAATGVGKCHTLETKIYEERLSRIYELELEDGTIRKIVGYRFVPTTRGLVRVCDLTQDDDIESLPIGDDTPDLQLPAM